VYRLTWRLPLAGLVAFSHLQSSQIRGRQPYLIVRKILYVIQRCTVHKHRNLLAHAPERLHDEITADYTDMIYAATPEAIAARRTAFIRKWRLLCLAPSAGANASATNGRTPTHVGKTPGRRSTGSTDSPPSDRTEPRRKGRRCA
jgi:hypothetical protein